MGLKDLSLLTRFEPFSIDLSQTVLSPEDKDANVRHLRKEEFTFVKYFHYCNTVILIMQAQIFTINVINVIKNYDKCHIFNELRLYYRNWGLNYLSRRTILRIYNLHKFEI